MKTLLFSLFLLACTACDQANQTPDPIKAAVGQEFVLVENQTATLTAEGLTVNVQLAGVEDTRCPFGGPKRHSGACVMGGSVKVRLVAVAGNERKQAEPCMGDCYSGTGQNFSRIPDSTDVQLQGKTFRVRLLAVSPHPNEEYGIPARQRQPKRATLLVRRL